MASRYRRIVLEDIRPSLSLYLLLNGYLLLKGLILTSPYQLQVLASRLSLRQQKGNRLISSTLTVSGIKMWLPSCQGVTQYDRNGISEEDQKRPLPPIDWRQGTSTIVSRISSSTTLDPLRYRKYQKKPITAQATLGPLLYKGAYYSQYSSLVSPQIQLTILQAIRSTPSLGQ